MRVISRSALRAFWTKKGCEDAEQPLRAWYKEAIAATWDDPAKLKEQYRNASILKDGRVVFNIGGNKYRLVVKIHYNRHFVFIRFVGTHAEYDNIDVNEV